MLCRLATAATLALALASPARAQAAERWSVSAPDAGRDAPTAVVARDDLGRLTLAVARADREVVRPSPLGLATTAADLTAGVRVTGARTATIDERYATVVGKRRAHRAHARELVLTLNDARGATAELAIRADADGIAYRYVVPGAGRQELIEERSGVVVDPAARAWTAPQQPDQPEQPVPSSLTPYYEFPRTEQAAGTAAGDVQLPVLFEVAGRDWVLATESALGPGYAGSHLRGLGGGRFAFALPAPDPSVSVDGTLTTPWRVLVVGDLATIVESDLVQDLAPPSQLTDTSWIRPGSVAWSWISEFSSPRSFARQRDYVDLAARQGWGHVLVDEGWSAAWVPELVRYAAARGVGVILWTRYSELDTPAKRAERLPLWRSWGVQGVKIDFVLCDCQARQRWYEDVLRETADLRLLVNFHGTTIPRGTERTWPHAVTFEAVWGQEQYGFKRETGHTVDPNPITSQTMLPFTRNAVGSMDFTPVSLSRPALDYSTPGYQLGTAVVFESGQQHWAETPENLARWPAAAAALRAIPTVWDDTRLVAGRPGSGAVIARRAGESWWLGAISAAGDDLTGLIGAAQGGRRDTTPAAPLTFLGDGPWEAHVIEDDGRGGLRTREQAVTRTDVLALGLRRNGGALVHVTRPADRPAAVRCASRRRFDIRVPGRRPRRATVTVDGERVRVRRRGDRLVARIDLRGRPRRTVTVRIRVVTRSGRRVAETRRYRLCVRRRAR